jgi:hypothetical protein
MTAKRPTSRSWVRAPPSAIPISKLSRAAVLLLFDHFAKPCGIGTVQQDVRTHWMANLAFLLKIGYETRATAMPRPTIATPFALRCSQRMHSLFADVCYSLLYEQLFLTATTFQFDRMIHGTTRNPYSSCTCRHFSTYTWYKVHICLCDR